MFVIESLYDISRTTGNKIECNSAELRINVLWSPCFYFFILFKIGSIYNGFNYCCNFHCSFKDYVNNIFLLYWFEGNPKDSIVIGYCTFTIYMDYCCSICQSLIFWDWYLVSYCERIILNKIIWNTLDFRFIG